MATDDASGGRAAFDPAELPTKAEVDAEAFHQLDLRVGRVIAVDDFPEARVPSLRLRVDLGPVLGVRETSAHITNYDHDELVGRQVVAAVNLGTRRIAGFDSQFLVLGGLAPDGSVCLLRPDAELPPGSTVA